MKRIVNLLCVCAVVAVFTMAASAAPGALNLRVQVPFAFQVSGKLLPAGVYTFDEASTAGTLLIRGENGESALAPTRWSGDTSAVEPTLIFEERGGIKVLVEIRSAFADGSAITLQ